jgi:DNA-directed RNA polymerase specialized sigma24 family protein
VLASGVSIVSSRKQAKRPRSTSIDAILELLGPDERIAFALRFIDDMELTDIAA